MHPYDQADTWLGHSSLVEELENQLDAPPAALVSCIGGGGLVLGLLEGLDRVGWHQVIVYRVISAPRRNEIFCRYTRHAETQFRLENLRLILSKYRVNAIRIYFLIWRHSVEKVYVGYNQNKSQQRRCILNLNRRIIFCLHLSPTSLHNLRNFVRHKSFLYIFEYIIWTLKYSVLPARQEQSLFPHTSFRGTGWESPD